MGPSPLSPHLATPAELKERIAAEQEGQPFLVYRDEQGRQRLFALNEARVLSIGREQDADIAIQWDPHVSGLHAELRPGGERWLVVDDGLSRNGTFVNNERVTGRRRLKDGDQMRVGSTVLVFRHPAVRRVKSTEIDSPASQGLALSPAQHRVLVALCRPFARGAAFARPATNRAIADELSLTVAAVKTHLRTLFPRFGLDGLPHNEKRARLAKEALQQGVVTPADFVD
jgi:pSer/pThr/pTyr-binding forkhead associated (FHA) protein